MVIGAITTVFAISSIAYALSLPNIYMADARLLASQQAASPVSDLTSQLGGLASIAGINLGGLQGGQDKARLAIEILRSRKFFEDYLFERVLVDAMAAAEWDVTSGKLILNKALYDEKAEEWRLDQNGESLKPSVNSAFSVYKSAVEVVKEGPYATISVHHLSPVVAKEWIELIVMSINEHVRERDADSAKASIEYLTRQQRETEIVNIEEVFSSLIEEQTKIMMLTDAKKDYVFQVIDPPVIINDRVSPNRTLICVLYTLLGIFVGSIAALLKVRLLMFDWRVLLSR